jgi:hypothetical protein
MTALNINHKPEEWRLFIDSSKSSLKTVVPHNGNVLPSSPVGYAVNMKESYDNMKLLLNCVNYKKYQWQVCGDLRVVAVLLGLQQGYTKFCCFLCEWDNRANTSHFKRRDWPSRQSLEPGTKNVQHLPLVESSNILLLLLHIKLGLMKNFVKAMDQTGPRWEILRSQCCKNQGGCFHRSSDLQALQRRTVPPHSQWQREEGVEWRPSCSNQLSRK